MSRVISLETWSNITIIRGRRRRNDNDDIDDDDDDNNGLFHGFSMYCLDEWMDEWKDWRTDGLFGDWMDGNN